MPELTVGGARPYPVRVARGALGDARELVAGRTHAVLTDTTVAPLHAAKLGLDDAPTLAVAPGEASKSFEGLELACDFLQEAAIDRAGVLVALGGGVVGDLSGLAASLHLRGIDVVHAPTTLLAQVDASIGGKTAINVRAGKNLVGTFHPPLAVLTDPEVLATLPDEEFAAGLGEVVKAALIGAPELLVLLEREAERVLARESEVLEEVLVASIGVKARIVAADEREGGVRATLNLGHTFAHAIEHAAGYGRVPHGVAVAVGLRLALEASERAGLLEDPELPGRIAMLLERLGLPTSLGELGSRSGIRWEADALRTGLRHDKKGRVGEPALVLVRGVGDVVSGVRLDPGTWEPLLEP